MKYAMITVASLLLGSAALAAPMHGGGGGMSSGSHMTMMPMASSSVTSASTTVAGNHPKSPLGTGQKDQSCQAGANYPSNTPGHSYNAPGSAFNPDGNAGTHYAGTQPQNSQNPKSVAQYDIACSNQK